MKRMTYQEQLNSTKWKKFRAKLLEKREYKCQKCQAIDQPLVVHHLEYIKGRLAWEYHPDLLKVLCNDCHRLEHECQICGDIGHKKENCPNEGFNKCVSCNQWGDLNLIWKWIVSNGIPYYEEIEYEYFGGWHEDMVCINCAELLVDNWNFFIFHKGQRPPIPFEVK